MNFPIWTPDRLQPLRDRLDGRSPQTLLAWAFKTFAPRIALATGFGPSGVVLMHMTAQIRPKTTVFYLDTDLLFPETYALRDELAERLDLRFTRLHSGLSLAEQEAQHGADLWAHNPNQCCNLRKVQPLRRFLATQQAWIAGLRRDQASSRAGARQLEWDYANGLVKLNPLAYWSEKQVWHYIDSHRLPYNPLHDAGYPSLGCLPCTRAVSEDEDSRAGRWAGYNKTECGIHLQPQP